MRKSLGVRIAHFLHKAPFVKSWRQGVGHVQANSFSEMSQSRLSQFEPRSTKYEMAARERTSMKKQKNETVPETPAAAQMHKHDD
jgi:hypothetical protein